MTVARTWAGDAPAAGSGGVGVRPTHMISSRKLEVFLVVARVGSITAAARELGISQPAVSAQLRELESVFKTELLYRDGNRMRLSEAGEVVCRYATTLAVATRDVIDHVHSLEAAELGSISVGATQSPGRYILPKQLVEFKKLHPGARLTLQVSYADDILDQIRHGQLDMAVVAGPEPPSDVQSDVFCEEELVLVCAPDNVLANSVVTRTDLRDVPAVSGSGRLQLDDRYAAFGLDRENIAIRMGDDEGIKCAVRDNFGLAILHRCAVAEDLRRGTLARVLVDGVSEVRAIYRIVSPYKHLSPIQRRLFDQLLDWHDPEHDP